MCRMARSCDGRVSAADDDARYTQGPDYEQNCRGGRRSASARPRNRDPDVRTAPAALSRSDGRTLAAGRRESSCDVHRDRRTDGPQRRPADPREGGRSSFRRDHVSPLGTRLGFGGRQAHDAHEIADLRARHTRARRLFDNRRAAEHRRHPRLSGRAERRINRRPCGERPTCQIVRITAPRGRSSGSRTGSRREHRPAHIVAAPFPWRRRLG